jgi:hypothetical protein
MLEGHVGQLSIAIMAVRQGGAARFETALWESMRITEEIAALLDEIDAVV